MANRRTGLVTFVGLLFLFAALFNAVVGILALLSAENAYHTSDPPFFNLDTLGIALLVLAGLQLITAIGIMTRRPGGEILGMILAVVGAAWTVLMERTNPSWAITLVIVNAIIVYVLAAHRHEFAH